MNETRTIDVAELQANCIRLVDELSDRRLEQLNVTRDGRVVAIVLPRPVAEAAGISDLPSLTEIFGCMRGSVIIPEGFDLTAPVWDGPLPGHDDLPDR